MPAFFDAVFGLGSSDVQQQRLLADESDVPVRLQRRGVLGNLSPDFHEVLGAQRSDLRLHRNVDNDVNLSDSLQLWILRVVLLRFDQVQRPLDRVV